MKKGALDSVKEAINKITQNKDKKEIKSESDTKKLVLKKGKKETKKCKKEVFAFSEDGEVVESDSETADKNKEHRNY